MDSPMRGDGRVANIDSLALHISTRTHLLSLKCRTLTLTTHTTTSFTSILYFPLHLGIIVIIKSKVCTTSVFIVVIIAVVIVSIKILILIISKLFIIALVHISSLSLSWGISFPSCRNIAHLLVESTYVAHPRSLIKFLHRIDSFSPFSEIARMCYICVFGRKTGKRSLTYSKLSKNISQKFPSKITTSSVVGYAP